MRHQIIAVLAALVALTTSACTIDVRGNEAVVREEKRFMVSGEPELRLRTFDGSIRLRSWDRNEVLVEIERRGPDTATAKAVAVNSSQQGNTVTVEAQQPKREGIHIGSSQSPSVSLTVTAPRRMRLDARTGDGSITADDLAGAITVNTGDGSIRIRRVEGALTAHTGDGSIDADGISGRLEASSGDGSIAANGRFELVDVRSGDGSVRVSADSGSAMKNDWNITTGDGSISVLLPPNIDAELDAQSNDGRVRANGFNGLSTSNGDDRGSVHGRLGNGGRTLRVRSGDGSISIDRR